MSRAIQFRLRTLFAAVTVTAVLCAGLRLPISASQRLPRSHALSSR